MYEAGVQLFVGSDAGGGISHGSYHEEIRLLARAGIPAPAIVGAATYHARTYLGVPGITEGAPADVVVYPTDPREDAEAPRHPSAIFRAGTRLKWAGVRRAPHPHGDQSGRWGPGPGII